ncbi:MAG TPA: homoserine dehydrogenase, partial [Nitrospira sp.]|nr:homoserine dehydrogenase [Nitrospira sp.]
MKSRIGVGIVGFGTVGTGVAKVLLNNASLISRRIGVPIELLRIADVDVTKDRGVALAPGVLTTEVNRVLTDPNIDIVVELIGGYDTAKRVILDAIAAGKHVVTANKALLAVHGEEIVAAAEAGGVRLGFEASVGGGIPILRTIKEGLVGDRTAAVY